MGESPGAAPSSQASTPPNDDAPSLPAILSDRWFWAIVLVALALRCAWALYLPVIPVSDSNAYDVFAQNIAEHGTYGWNADEPGAYWPPGTSMIYAASYAVFGHTYAPLEVFHIVLGVLTVALTMIMAAQHFSFGAAYAGGLVLALWPSWTMYVTILASEHAFTLLLVLGVALAIWPRMPFWARLAGSSVALGLACYMRPTALLVPILIGAWMAVRRHQWLRGGVFAAVGIVLILAIMSPWTIRTSQLAGEFKLMSTNLGPTLWMGNHEGEPVQSVSYPEEVKARDMDEFEREAFMMDEAVAYIKEKPVAFVIRSFRKLLIFHGYETIAVTWNTEGLEQRGWPGWSLEGLKLLATAWWWAAGLLGVAGVVLIALRQHVLEAVFHPVFTNWAYLAAVHSVVLAQDRYHFPVTPLVAILAGVALYAGWQRFVATPKTAP